MKNTSSKTLMQVFIYLLIVGGALMMLLPFAWMVDTSFKASSEVSSWPPKWTTKNARSSVEFKTKIRYQTTGSGVDLSSLSLDEFKNFASLVGSKAGEDTLIVMLDDDFIRRGTIILGLLDESGNPADFSMKADLDKFSELTSSVRDNINNYPDTIAKKLESIPLDEVAGFFDGFLNMAEYSDDGFARRIVLTTSIETTAELSQKKAETVIGSSFKALPTDSESQRKLKEDMVNRALELFQPISHELTALATDLSNYRIGEKRVPDPGEVSAIISKISQIEKVFEAKKAEIYQELSGMIPSTDRFLLMMLNRFKGSFDGIIDELVGWKVLLEDYLEIKEFYIGIQDAFLEDAYIVGRIRTDDEVHALLISAIDDWNVPGSLKEYLKASITEKNVRDALKILISYLDGNFKEELRANFSELTNEVFDKITEAINLLKTATIIVDDDKFAAEITEFMEDPFSYQEFKALMKEAGARSGQSALFGGALAYLDRYAEKMGGTGFSALIKRRWVETNWIGDFSKLHSDIFSELDLVKKPSQVLKVFYRGRATKSGRKSFEIKFDGVPAVWFKDDLVYGKAEFTFLETFANFWQNYVDAWNAAPFGRYYLNTVFVAIVTTFLEIIFASMAAFAFAKMEFFGKNFMFTIFLATMMVPGEVLLVPNFITLTVFGWIDTYYALIVPWVISVFAIFLLRQHFMTIPDELYDAAKIDGLSKWKFLWKVMVPLSKPAVITGALLKFVGSWNAFLWVLIVTKSPEYRTLPVGLQNFSSATGTEYNLLMAAATFSIVPVVLLFLFTQKYFIAGIARSGLK
ncbi:ABC transporter permease [Kosmotoga arenicorallina S304]|uniref:ABC transporter permease n=1 Tax=Kosmotoga arenicorallina S304 TaxID=1453497 RepID=A0A176K0G5_9BACT|nr:carbohydrate ABC transporter permease [Kosmotoga arenicorallina]OAA30097.1 ABC transporter permease [Kosmotoga arenicorallina S304]